MADTSPRPLGARGGRPVTRRGSPGPFPWPTLARPLRAAERSTVEAVVRHLLRWQRSLRGWPAVTRAPDATPFVSLYTEGRLVGCFGSHEGTPGERLARAFLRAAEDSRFGGLHGESRDSLVAQVAYAHGVRGVSAAEILEQIEPGTHGVALFHGTRPVNLLPQVTRDNHLAPEALLRALAKKAGLGPEGWRSAELALFETEEIVVHAHGPAARRETRPVDRAAAWLARIVGDDGAVIFSVDARKRTTESVGPMRHGRCAVAVQALAAHGGHAARVKRARRWLVREIEAGLRGNRPEGWPDEPAMVGGTLALATLAGADVYRPLAEFARAEAQALAEHPWHAAQVAGALGADTPATVWRACVTDLDARPWAPWTALAAQARGDARVVARTAKALAASLRAAPPHEGGASVTSVPETALTAVAVEALARVPGAEARRAVARGRAFLRKWQLTCVPAPLDPSLALGAFPASPIADALRCDITGHALLALL